MRPRPADAAAIETAAAILRRGGLVAFPTETVYGLGADATDDAAVARIFAAKGRPRFNPLIVHVADRAEAEALVRFDDRARRLSGMLWPGPLTMVLPRRDGSPVSLLASAGLDTIAVRIPDGAVALDLIRRTGRPIAAPSANRSFAISPTEAAHVADSLGDAVDLILDGGPCRVGLESTVIDLTGPVPVLLRPGGAPVETIESLIGRVEPATPAENGSGAPRSPGMLDRHYAPDRPLRLDAREPRPGEALLGFGTPGGHVPPTLNLSPAGDLVEAAANLFRMMRELDRPPHSGIAVAPIPRHGLGLAINDRLRRAATPAVP